MGILVVSVMILLLVQLFSFVISAPTKDVHVHFFFPGYNSQGVKSNSRREFGKDYAVVSDLPQTKGNLKAECLGKPSDPRFCKSKNKIKRKLKGQVGGEMELDYQILLPKKSQTGTNDIIPGDYAGGMIIGPKQGKKTKEKVGGEVGGEMEIDYLPSNTISAPKKSQTEFKKKMKIKKKHAGEIGGEIEITD